MGYVWIVTDRNGEQVARRDLDVVNDYFPPGSMAQRVFVSETPANKAYRERANRRDNPYINRQQEQW